MHACKCVQTVHHISNLTLRSGSVFVRKAAPTVEACEQVGTTTEFAIFEDCHWAGRVFCIRVAPGNQRIGPSRNVAPGCSCHYPFPLDWGPIKKSRPEASHRPWERLPWFAMVRDAPSKTSLATVCCSMSVLFLSPLVWVSCLSTGYLTLAQILDNVILRSVFEGLQDAGSLSA